MNLRNNTKEIIAISGTLISFLVFVLIVRFSVLNLGYLVNMPSTLINFMFVDTAGAPLIESISALLMLISSSILALIFIALGLSFLSAYGFFNDERRIGLIASLIATPFIIIAFGFSFLSVFISIGLIVTCYYMPTLSNTYAKELKKWVFFRTGSNSISKALLIFNIIVAVGIFMTMALNPTFYGEQARSSLSDTMSSVAIGLVGVDMDETMYEQAKVTMSASIENSDTINNYVSWLPVITAFSVWFVLEFFRSIIISNVGGIFTAILITLNSRIKK